MNKEIYEVYHNLTDTRKAGLRNRYKDSPLVLKFMDFLAGADEPEFRNAEAVQFIYGKKSGDEKYSVLENRYFKLRKKVYDELCSKADSATHNEQLPEEEALLNRCKQLIATGDKKEAYRLLTGLEKQCWERNIFELLPTVLDNMIYCNQGFNELDKNKPLYKKLEEAIELQYDLNRALMYIRQVYEAFFLEGPGAEKSLLLALKELGDKHKDYPRFIMLYHYVSVSYKLGSMDYAGNMQVISRHLAEFKRLYGEHPFIPIVIYKTGHDRLFHFHYNQITTFYHTNRGEFEEAYHSTKEMFNLALSGDPLFRTYKTDSLYINMFAIQCVTGRYNDALDSCGNYTAFIKQTGRIDKLSMANMMRALLYVMAYPQTLKMDGAYLLEQAGKYIAELKRGGDNIQLPLAQAMLVKTQMYMLQGDYKKAVKMMDDPMLPEYLESIKAKAVFGELLQALAEGNVNAESEIQKRVTQLRYKAIKIDEFMIFKWLNDFIERRKKANKKP